jgi:aryl-alcohol dehydrogenase-like predicted oxidoreductase
MSESAVHAELPYRVLGSTGERVSAIGLGGWHLGFKQVDEQLSIHIVRSAIDREINFMDNCWDYNDGASEIGWARRSATATGTEHS